MNLIEFDDKPFLGVSSHWVLVGVNPVPVTVTTGMT